MQIHLSEQDVVDACCAYVADRQRKHPSDVEVDLFYEPDVGFGFSAKSGWKSEAYRERDMVDAVAWFLDEYHNFPQRDLDVHLQFPDENRIEAYVRVR